MSVSCEQATRWTDAWIDGELDPSAALLIEDHMGRCACCRAEADMVKKLKRACGAMREDCAPTALRYRITAALDACDREQEAEHQQQLPGALEHRIEVTPRHATQDAPAEREPRGQGEEREQHPPPVRLHQGKRNHDDVRRRE